MQSWIYFESIRGRIYSFFRASIYSFYERNERLWATTTSPEHVVGPSGPDSGGSREDHPHATKSNGNPNPREANEEEYVADCSAPGSGGSREDHPHATKSNGDPTPREANEEEHVADPSAPGSGGSCTESNGDNPQDDAGARNEDVGP
jgi:hypothetical protein